ncbi:hypothetical protein ACKWTF_008771 [Chironomus riparius]
MGWTYLMSMLIIFIFPDHVQCSYVDKIMKASTDPNYHKTWMYMPDDEGVLHEISLNYTFDNLRAVKKLDEDTIHIARFWLFTEKNKKVPIEIKSSEDDNLLSFQFPADFDANKPTKIIIHGWLDKYHDQL